MRRFLLREDGIALVMAVGVVAVLSITAATALYYTSTNTRSADYSKASSRAHSLAEAGIAEALSRLAVASDPVDPNLLPATTITLDGGTATYSGALAGTLWTITSIGQLRNPTGSADVRRTLTREVSVQSLDTGSISIAWDRTFHNSTTSCLTIPSLVTLFGKVVARGNLCLNGNGSRIAGNTSTVAVGGNVTLQTGSPGASIGASGGNVLRADVAGTCNGTTCGPSTKVFAGTITNSPGTITKPTVNFGYWYSNALLGPANACDTQTGTPPAFDNGGGYSNSNAAVNVTPSGSSYTCRALDADGSVIGELSWNHSTKVLTVKGTIFFDGNVTVGSNGSGGATQQLNYNGRATLFAAGTLRINGVVCAGGNGTNNCRTNVGSWTPAANLLVGAAGGLTASGNDVLLSTSADDADVAFQGMLYAVHDCFIEEYDDDADLYWSGPITCERLILSARESGNGPTIAAWPSMPGQAQGQVTATDSTNEFQLLIGKQSG